MTTIQKLFNITVVDVITIILAIPVVMFLTGDMNTGGLVGIVIGNRVAAIVTR